MKSPLHIPKYTSLQNGTHLFRLTTTHPLECATREMGSMSTHLGSFSYTGKTIVIQTKSLLMLCYVDAYADIKLVISWQKKDVYNINNNLHYPLVCHGSCRII